MDVNGSRFHLLLTREDWGRATASGVGLETAWDASPPQDAAVGVSFDAARHALTLAPLTPRFIAPKGDTQPRLDQRRGASLDAFGNLYWIEEDGVTIRALSAGGSKPGLYWPIDDHCEPRVATAAFAPAEPAAPRRRKLAGLAVTTDHHLVVGVLEPAGLMVFDLHSVGEPVVLNWPRAIPFAPYDIAARPDGGVVVLDRANRRTWRLDRNFAVEPGQSAAEIAPIVVEAFQPVVGDLRIAEAQTFPAGAPFDVSPVTLGDIIAVEALGDGAVLLLEADGDDGFARVVAFRDGQPHGDPVSLSLFLGELEEDARAGFSLRGHDMAFLPDPEAPTADRGTLYVVSAEGNQTFAMSLAVDDFGLALRADRAFLPMRRFAGKGLAAGAGQVFYDFGRTWVPLIAQPSARYIRQASLETDVLDSKIPDCVWHRVLLDACLPPGAAIAVESRAAESREALANAPWRAEPPPYLRSNGRELPYTVDPTTHDPGAGTWELLFQKAQGRFAQIRLTLTGNERVTPRITAMRAWYPRFSYAEQYLPAIYREEPEPASFLDRFLANIEGTLTTVEDRLAAAQALIDVRSAPADSLDWLAGWFGVALDPSWDERRRRLFIRHAMTLFAWRGTTHGLRMALALALDPCIDEAMLAAPDQAPARPHDIRIIERFMTRRFSALSLGDPLELAGPRVLPLTPAWRPADGAARLQQLWVEAGGAGAFPVAAPADPDAAQAWRAFAATTLGFVPSVLTADLLSRWRLFLARRYQRIRVLNQRYATSWDDFNAVPYPDRLPVDGPALEDWRQFEGTVLAMGKTAHRFSVLAPAPRIRADRAKARARIDLARRIVELEKPAHTTFSVGLYWALFRVGEARLELDTVLEAGSRSPDLLPPIVLGLDYVGEGHLDRTLPTGRQVLECA
ncbi:phage tail protein [Phenylobacterium immobile]|uniref:phage tail protein n=1 Tax=Phenylobacterium immobile TaxID=21 RepID=UPI000A9BB3C4|nr:phage tail protein [Phenylobacterium immobile]